MQQGIIKGLDDGFYKQAKIAQAEALKGGHGNGHGGPLFWLTDKVLETYAETGKDYRGRDIDPEADLRKHVEQVQQLHGRPTDSARRKAILAKAALETYGISKELAARDIRPERGDTGEKFFGPGAENSPLFPALLASTFIVSRLSAGLADLMAYADVNVNRLSVDKVRLNEAEDDRRLRNVGIGDPLPRTELSHVDTTVKMRKYGRLFSYAREVVTMQPLAVVQGFVSQMSRQIAIDETDEVIEILHAGDGETGSAVTDTTPATDGTLVYADLIKLELAFSNGYAGQVYLADATNFQNILLMSEYKDPLANRGVMMDRDIPCVNTPSGIGKLWRWSSTNSTYMAETGGRILAVDPRLAAYMARTALLEEQDTIISNGRQEVALSYMMAVVKGDPSCTKSLDVTA
jgi:hypothetical protein